MVKVLLALLISASILFSSKMPCDKEYKKYGINKNIKAPVRWRKVCNNNKLLLYISDNEDELNDVVIKKLCDCLGKVYKSRSNGDDYFLGGDSCTK